MRFPRFAIVQMLFWLVQLLLRGFCSIADCERGLKLWQRDHSTVAPIFVPYFPINLSPFSALSADCLSHLINSFAVPLSAIVL